MSAVSVNPPFPIFTDTDGQPLENGYIWIGTVNLDPQGNPITVYWDAALTQVAGQPIRTSGGYPVRNGSPARLYVNSDYSIRVQNKNGSTVYSSVANTEAVGDISSALVTFVQSGAGAVSRTVQSKLRDTVSVKDFGAVGDGVADDTAAFASAQDASDFVYVPPGTYVLVNFRHKTGKTFFCAGAKTIIKQGNPAQPAWNMTSDVTYGQLIDIAILGRPAFQGAASSTCELLRMSAAAPYAIQNAEVDIRASGGYHSLKMYVTFANEIYASRIKVTQTNSLNTGCILGGVYNQYWMHIAGSANGFAVQDVGWNSVFTQLVTEGAIQCSGQNVTAINPTVESWVGSSQPAAMLFTGINPTIINANLVEVPSAKAEIGLTLNGGGGGPFTILGFRVIGSTNYPTYPIEIPAGNTGLISSAFCQNKGFALDVYTPDSVLQGVTFAGDCSTLTAKGKIYYGSATYDPPNLADGAGTTTTVTVTGVTLGDYVEGVSFSNDLQGITVTGWVSATNTVSVRFQNESGGALDLASGTLKAKVTKL